MPPAVATVFDDLDRYVAAPRVSDMAMSVDGSRVVVVVSRLDTDKVAYVGALWEIDVEGSAPARRLTWSEHGETGPAFTADGDLYFLRRTSEDDESAAVWCLPAGVGEAHVVSKRGAGYSGLETATHSPRFVAMSDVMPSAGTEEEDERLRQLRKDKKVGAILHTGYPIRHWDRDLGPATPHLYVGDVDGGTRRVIANAEGALHEASYSISADGSFAVSTWTVRKALATSRTVLIRVDLDTGTRTTIVDDDDADLGSPSISPDGSRVAFVRESLSTPEQAPRMTLQQYVFGDRTVYDLAPEWDRWPSNPVWLPDGTGVLVVADDRGRAPVFLVRDGVANPVTTTDSAYSHLHVASTGVVMALEASYRQPMHPVRIDIESGVVYPLALPDPLPALPGTLTEVETVTEDGRNVRAWLALPADASESAQAPLLLWVHGGPLSSWNTWSWRWNPWVMVAQGYAVLLPDPALSTGYGQSFVDRGWGRWGKEPFTDLMAVTDAAAALEEVDGTRTAAMGGSFGGYMANWIAGHTDRFDAIVTHAGLWALDQFGPTTDASYYWQREMSPEMAFENSPHLYVADIDTPMLVIHGDKDYRVPIGEGLRLWFELLSESGLPTDDEGKTDHRLLYFPSENHWVLAPQHAKIWYEVVLSFLSEHVLGIETEIPEMLG